MNLTNRPIGIMPKKRTLVGILVLSLALVPCAAVAELNDGLLSSTGKSAPVLSETNAESDQRFLAAFRAAPLSLTQAIAIAERLHTGSRTAAISFDISDNPFYRVATIKDEEIWENVVDVRTGRIVEPETSRNLNELEREERDTIGAFRAVNQELSDAVAIAEKAAAGKAISGAMVKEGDQLNFVVVVLSNDQLKEVFLEPPRATSKDRPAASRRH
jgi:Peptidase propeptide and YPEB domain